MSVPTQAHMSNTDNVVSLFQHDPEKLYQAAEMARQGFTKGNNGVLTIDDTATKGRVLVHKRGVPVGTYDTLTGNITMTKAGNYGKQGRAQRVEAGGMISIFTILAGYNGVSEVATMNKYLAEFNATRQEQLSKFEAKREAELPPQGISSGTITKRRKQAKKSKARLIKATDMAKPAEVEWLAKDKLPRGGITVLLGEEGIGKSLLWTWLAAKITTGTPAPEFGLTSTKPGTVALLAGENSWQYVDAPRLAAAGYNPENFLVFAEDTDGSGAPAFDSAAYNMLMSYEGHLDLVVADPWLDTVPSDLHVSKSAQDAKEALRPWRELAVAKNCAVLLVTHTNRMKSANARDIYGATAQLRTSARMTLYAQLLENGRLAVGVEKTNLTAQDTKAVEFAFNSAKVAGFKESVVKFDFAAESTHTARELIEQKHAEDTDTGDMTQREQLDAMLLGLFDNVKWVPAKVAMKEVNEAQLGSTTTVARRRNALGIQPMKSGGAGSAWYWVLNSHAKEFEAAKKAGTLLGS